MTEMLVFDETPQKRKVSRLTKSIKYLSPTQSIVYALRHWGHVSQREIADSLGCTRQNIEKAEGQAGVILKEGQFPRSHVVEEGLIVSSNVNNGRLAPLKGLTSLQAFVGALRLGLLKSQQEIAEIFDCTPVYVGHLQREGIIALGHCRIAEIWNRIKVGGPHPPRSLEQRRVRKEHFNDPKLRQAISERMIKFYQTPRGLARKKEQSEEAKKRQRKWLKEPRHINKREQQFQDLLTRWGFLYKYVGNGVLWIGPAIKSKYNSPPCIRGCRNPDFIHRFFPGIIELYGDYSHRKEKLENGGDNGQSKIDHYATFLEYNTLIIWEHELKDAMKNTKMALDLYNKLYDFELKLREEFRSEFGVDFPTQFSTFCNPA